MPDPLNLDRLRETFTHRVDSTHYAGCVYDSRHTRCAILALCDEVARLREIIADALDPGVFGEPFGMLSPEDIDTDPIGRSRILVDVLGPICEHYGYGAVMQMASSLWEWRQPGAAITTAACSSVRRSWIERAKAALPAKEAPDA